ncbi:N-alpha-acetyltransferase 35 natc auxiliary subunit [Phtheirospermum japonicum]|uniref:N-alpha-acetyltransferase 35 natc auxiliary subunit n=1 Tax=Phtheirospermum japonicum TaxID=374723 RepID=A0A830CAT7_9LAMI|nr:N-alpha-acetyltransferase 35 natc auxiliary subunit [Phtheirospermum japonicum]
MADKSVVEGGEDVKVPISPSIPSGNDNVWADVSSLLRLACDDLRNDELICGENFNLFAAMSALEIMDPKMDSGIVSTYYSVDEAIDNGAAPVPLSCDRAIDIQRVIDIMDHLLACEATWHTGGSLAQTVFSCIYLLRPERMSTHALLHSFCRVIRMTCNSLLSAVSDARANEVDGDEKCLSILHAVEETVSRQLKACKAPLSRKRVVEDVEPLQTNLELEEGFCKSVLCRLRFRKITHTTDGEYLVKCCGGGASGGAGHVVGGTRGREKRKLAFHDRHFYHVLTCMRRPQGKGLELAKKHIQACITELDSMLKSEEFLRHAFVCEKGGIEDKTTASGCQPIGFDSTLNSRSAAPTPPRAIKLLSWKKVSIKGTGDGTSSHAFLEVTGVLLPFLYQAVNYFQKLLHDLEIVCSYSLDPVLEDALRLVVDFQKFQPDLVSRAYIQLLLVQDGKLYGRETMFAVVCKAALLPEGAKNHDVQKSETVAQLGQLELAFRKEFGDITSTSIDQNACLKICKHVLIWVEEQTYWIALRFLILGFELELYSTSEYCMVYWYIYVILIKLAEKTHLKMMLSNDSVRRKSKKKRDFVKDVGKDYQIPPAVLLLQCYIYVAEGLMMMLASLRNENKILCLGPFNSEQEDAQKIAKELRGNFANDPDRLAELRRIEQVAEHNSVALNLICQLGTLEPSLKVSFEFIHHPHFAVAAVKRS